MRDIADRARLESLRTTVALVDPAKQSIAGSVLQLKAALAKPEAQWTDADYLCVKGHLREPVEQFPWTELEQAAEVMPSSFLYPVGDRRRYSSDEMAERVKNFKPALAGNRLN